MNSCWFYVGHFQWPNFVDTTVFPYSPQTTRSLDKGLFENAWRTLGQRERRSVAYLPEGIAFVNLAGSKYEIYEELDRFATRLAGDACAFVVTEVDSMDHSFKLTYPEILVRYTKVIEAHQQHSDQFRQHEIGDGPKFCLSARKATSRRRPRLGACNNDAD